MHTARIGATIATALLLSNVAGKPVSAAAPSTTLRFALPGGAAILYSKASDPQTPLSQRSWQQAVFHLPNGTKFRLQPRSGESDSDGTQMEPPSDSNISPSGQYVIIGRIESGTVSLGPGQAESVMSREYCTAVEIRTGCITADQTGEICGAGWQTGQPAQWGTDDQTSLMLKDDRPSASRLLRFINSGQPPQSVIDDDSGADNVLRCDPPSSTNRVAYERIVSALRAAGMKNGAGLFNAALSNKGEAPVSTSGPAATVSEHRAAIISVQKATLYDAPDEARVTRSYLVKNDTVIVLKQSPTSWAYVDYINSSGKHLLRWIKADDLAIKP